VVAVSPPPPPSVTPPIGGADPVSLALAGLPALATAIGGHCSNSVTAAGLLGVKTASTHEYLSAADAALAQEV
jgi:uncharacterized MnhB-related membrane protein